MLTWPLERQADVAHVAELMEEQDNSILRLTEEQAAEVRRRLATPSPQTIPAEEVFKRFRSPAHNIAYTILVSPVPAARSKVTRSHSQDQ